ncbi:MAG: CU044_2847 family protein [Cyanobacteria bacterium P01_F01_bin.86]
MKQLVEFDLEDGSSILVEVEEPVQNATQRAALNPQKVAYKANQAFNAAIRHTIRPTAIAVVGEVRNLPDPPEEVEAKFGLKLSMSVGAVITAGSEANFEVTLKWKSLKSL